MCEPRGQESAFYNQCYPYMQKTRGYDENLRSYEIDVEIKSRGYYNQCYPYMQKTRGYDGSNEMRC